MKNKFKNFKGDWQYYAAAAVIITPVIVTAASLVKAFIPDSE